MNNSIQTASNDDLEVFFGVAEDKRREILKKVGLPKRRLYPWSEVLSAICLDPKQLAEVAEVLFIDPEEPVNDRSRSRRRLWGAQRVADEIGVTAATVNGWVCKSTAPAGFPRPICEFGKKTRLWLPLEIRAYHQPSLYADLAAQIRRRKVAKPAKKLSGISTLAPLPPP